MKIIIVKKENFTEIKKFLKILAPNAEVDFIEPENLEKSSAKIKTGAGAPDETFLFYNFDDESLREAIKDLEFSASGGRKISFGLSGSADFFSSDENTTDDGINFKLNYKGSSVPIWLKSQNREDILSCLAAISVAVIFGANMVEVSEKLKVM